jgi:acetate kinase
MIEPAIIALNSGSSSLKFGLYRVGPAGVVTIMSGKAETLGQGKAVFHAQDGDGRELISETISLSHPNAALDRVRTLIGDRQLPAPAAVGHRVVHGGPSLRRHCLLDDAVLSELEAATPFAPLHIPPALEVIREAERLFPSIPKVACFDTAFHAGMPDVARILPLPREFRAEGIERYGFHGLSCESIVRQLGDVLPARLVIAHLGNGASVTAVENGRSVDTSMGLTPSGGVIMGTRTGDLDPGVLIYLARARALDPDQLEQLIDRQSGLLGISGIDSDMRRLHEAAVTDPDARLAVDMFCYSVRKQIAAMAAALGGIDMLLFTGGIGEHDAVVRGRICGGLSVIGVTMARVLPSQEDEQIALHSAALIAA